MFREMRRKRQALSEQESIEILKQGSVGVLGLLGDDDYPYALPISYVYHEGKIYFHCAKAGHKIDAIRKHDKASFTVIARCDNMPEEFTVYFKSALAFGRMRIIEDDTEKRAAIERLAQKYCPDEGERAPKEIEKAWKILCMLEFSVEHLTGKQSMELVK